MNHGTHVAPLKILNLKLNSQNCEGLQVQLDELSFVPGNVGKTQWIDGHSQGLGISTRQGFELSSVPFAFSDAAIWGGSINGYKWGIPNVVGSYWTILSKMKTGDDWGTPWLWPQVDGLTLDQVKSICTGILAVDAPMPNTWTPAAPPVPSPRHKPPQCGAARQGRLWPCHSALDVVMSPPKTHILLLLYIYIYINGYWNSEINRSRLRSSWIQHGSKDGPVTSQSGSTNWGMTAYCNLIPTYTSTTAETHGFEAPRLACRHQLSYAEDRTPGQWGVHARCIPKAGAPGSGQTSVCSILCHQWVQLWFNYVLTIYIYIYINYKTGWVNHLIV